jgi:hypothetical protein
MPRLGNQDKVPETVLCPQCEEPLNVERNMLLRDPTCPHCGAFIDMTFYGGPTEAAYEAAL